MEEGMIGSCGESAHPLESLKLSILSRVPGYGHFEQLDKAVVEGLLIPTSKLKFDG